MLPGVERLMKTEEEEHSGLGKGRWSKRGAPLIQGFFCGVRPEAGGEDHGPYFRCFVFSLGRSLSQGLPLRSHGHSAALHSHWRGQMMTM